MEVFFVYNHQTLKNKPVTEFGTAFEIVDSNVCLYAPKIL